MISQSGRSVKVRVLFHGPGESLGIVDRDLVGDVFLVGAGEALHRMHGVAGGWPTVSSPVLSLNPTVSTTSVSPSHLPMEFPIQVGSDIPWCGRPSVWTISNTFHASYSMATQLVGLEDARPETVNSSIASAPGGRQWPV